MTYAHPRRGNAKPRRFAFQRASLPEPLAYFTTLEQLKLTGSGEWRSAVCPFHNDTQPSLRINIRSGGWRCMVCGAHGGDVLAFHMQRHDLPFIEAAKALGAWEARP